MTGHRGKHLPSGVVVCDDRLRDDVRCHKHFGHSGLHSAWAPESTPRVQQPGEKHEVAFRLGVWSGFGHVTWGDSERGCWFCGRKHSVGFECGGFNAMHDGDAVRARKGAA